jgi:hypothetical protein
MPNVIDYSGEALPDLYFVWAEDMESRGFDYDEAMDAIIKHGTYGNAMSWIVNNSRKKSLAFKLGFVKVVRYPRRSNLVLVQSETKDDELVTSPDHKKRRSSKPRPSGLKEFRQRRNSDSLITGSIKLMNGTRKGRPSKPSDDEDEDQKSKGEERISSEVAPDAGKKSAEKGRRKSTLEDIFVEDRRSK